MTIIEANEIINAYEYWEDKIYKSEKAAEKALKKLIGKLI